MSTLLPFTKAVGTSDLASAFSEAAGRQPLDAQPQPFVTYFLLGHALELAWKSVLIAEGVTEKELRNIGHDLRAARDGAEVVLGKDQPSRGEVFHLTEMIADYYSAKALEYLMTGYYSLPEAAQAASAVSTYVRAVDDWINNRVRERLRTGDSPD